MPLNATRRKRAQLLGLATEVEGQIYDMAGIGQKPLFLDAFFFFDRGDNVAPLGKFEVKRLHPAVLFNDFLSPAPTISFLQSPRHAQPQRISAAPLT